MTEPASPPPAAPTPTRAPWVLPLITGVGGFIVGAALVGAIMAAALNPAAEGATTSADAEEVTVFSDALDACGVSDKDNAAIGDDGRTLTLNMRGQDEFDGLSFTAIDCILQELDVPAAVDSHIGQTTSMDGRQSETWNGITFSWSYHPDRGLDGVLTYEPPEQG